jgi:hypothetical protein
MPSSQGRRAHAGGAAGAGARLRDGPPAGGPTGGGADRGGQRGRAGCRKDPAGREPPPGGAPARRWRSWRPWARAAPRPGGAYIGSRRSSRRPILRTLASPASWRKRKTLFTFRANFLRHRDHIHLTVLQCLGPPKQISTTHDRMLTVTDGGTFSALAGRLSKSCTNCSAR